MKRIAMLAAAIACGSLPAHAQSRQQPNLVLSIMGGMTTGQPLWTIPAQQIGYQCSSFTGLPPCSPSSDTRDTVRLGRRLRPGLVALVGATYYRSPHWGWALEVGYFGVASEGRCDPVVPLHPDSERKNEQACNQEHGGHFATSIVAFQAGLSYRAQLGISSPYLKVMAGLGAMGNSYVQSVQTIFARGGCSPSLTCGLTLMEQDRRRSATYVGTLAAGATVPLGTGYQFRAEVRDFIAGIPVALDSSTLSATTPYPVARTAVRTKHIFTLTAGIDVILERRHRRRY